MVKLKIITASTRPSRKGPSISNWIFEKAKAHQVFDVELLDLATINLPMMDEPEHPRLKKYHHDHTKAWSSSIDSADAFIFVTPEYNYSLPAPLKNAIDYLFHEWAYKPVAFVSYGGMSGGIRCAQMLKEVVTTLKMMPLVESMAIQFFTKHIDENGVFKSEEPLDKSAEVMLRELVVWSNALAAIRHRKQ